MIYVQQVRSRKESLVPIRNEMDSDVKIEILDVTSLNGVELISMDMDSDQFIEVVTSPSTPESSNGGDTPRPRKRAKLDHMTADQKAQHRKMMNRISAQSARDRQKAFISEQEKTIRRLVSDNESLKEQNHSLLTNSDKLTEENSSLRSMVEDLERKLKKMSSMTTEVKIKEEPSSVEESTMSCCDSSEPAVLSTVPLQKGLELQQTLAFLLVMWALSQLQLTLTPRTSSKPWKPFLTKSSVQKANLPLLSRSSPQNLATSEMRALSLQCWTAMKADLPG